MNDTLEAVHVVCPHCAAVNRIPAARLAEAPNCGRCHATLFDGRPLDLNETDFDRHLKRSDIPLVVDFWAPWCGPCRMMAPAFEAAAGELAPHARLAKVNTEDHPALAARFGIRSIPTLAVFQGGRETARQAGAMDKRNLIRWIRTHV